MVLSSWRYAVAMLMVLTSLVAGGVFPVFRSGESGSAYRSLEGWEDGVCHAIGCPNSSDLPCATVSGTMEVVVIIFGKRWVIYEEEYTIKCTQGRV